MGSDDSDPDAEGEEVVVRDGKKQRHRVRITRSFYLGVTEVTRGQFEEFVDDTGYKTDAEKDSWGGFGWDEEKREFRQDRKFSWRHSGFGKSQEHPVVNVSWNDAVAFCEWLRRKEGQPYRLPTEAEWEYACRAGTTTRYISGDDSEALHTFGNVSDPTAKAIHPELKETISASDGFVYTAPVAQFKANGFGLNDTHGNVWEWCQDVYDPEYYKSSPMDDPICSVGTAFRVLRGGSWGCSPRCCRSAYRERRVPEGCYDSLGFRVARGKSGQ